MQRRILIADPLAANRIVFRVRLGDAFYCPLLATDVGSCLQKAREERPDLIVLDFDLSDPAGPSLTEQLRADPACAEVPVIALVNRDDRHARLAALRAGATDVLTKPPDITLLMARIRNLLRRRDEADLVSASIGGQLAMMPGLAEPAAAFLPAGEIGIISEGPERALNWKLRFARAMRDHVHIMTPEEASGLGPREPAATPDVFLIDADRHGSEGAFRLMSQLAGSPGARNSLFGLMMSPGDPDAAAMAFDLGAEDVMDPAIATEELELRVTTMLTRKREADRARKTIRDGLRLSLIDPLTGAYNRRYALPRLSGIAGQAQASGAEFAVMVVDLDRFKSINDRYGHAAGDAVLVEVVRRLTTSLRMEDLLARIGGEEFLVALPSTSPVEAGLIAEKLRRIIGEEPFSPGPGLPPLHVTISIGLRTGNGSEPVSAMVEAADHALRLSKTAGRNIVTLCRSAA